MKEYIRDTLISAGAAAVGFAKAGHVDKAIADSFREWVDEGYNAGMEYLKRHIPLRTHTDNVLPQASSVISIAFCYKPETGRDKSLPMIASYAFGQDYHEVLRKKLFPVIKEFKERFGGEWRLCVDSAPIEERYWALKSGIGIRGKNGLVIVDGVGSFCFLCELLTTIEIPEDNPSEKKCEGCDACLRACPGGAILPDGKINAKKCISYLTIEKRGDWNQEEKEIIKDISDNTNFLFGCDICQQVCPHNKIVPPTRIEEFQPLEGILQLSTEEIEKMTEEEFNKRFRNSPLRRAGLASLQRNLKPLNP